MNGLIKTPAYEPRYHVGGNYVAQLCADARATLNTALDAKGFHTLLLVCGPAPKASLKSR